MQAHQILVEPAYKITSISDADPAVITTNAAHGIQTGDTVEISGLNDESASNPWSQLNGRFTATRTSNTTFSITESTASFDDSAWASSPSPTDGTVRDLSWDGRYYPTGQAFTGTPFTMKSTGGLPTCLVIVEATQTPGAGEQIDVTVEGRAGPGFSWTALDAITHADTFTSLVYSNASCPRRPEMRIRVAAATTPGDQTVIVSVIEH